MTIEQALPWISALIALLAFVASARKDSRSSAAEDAKTQAKLDAIAGGVDDIRIDQRAMRDKVDMMNERLARVEASASSAHKRIDTMEQKGA